jgi:signal transduction histidine kinase
LTNVAKHSGATHAQVRVSDQGNDVVVTVHDDGEGFDTRASSPGFGLVGMRERLALVQGSLVIESSPGAGTQVRATIPNRRRSDGVPSARVA